MEAVERVRATLHDRQLGRASLWTAGAVIAGTILAWVVAVADAEAVVLPYLLYGLLAGLLVIPILAVADFVAAYRARDRGMTFIGIGILLTWIVAAPALLFLVVFLVDRYYGI